MKIEGCAFPDDLLYDVENNSWVSLEGEKARIGINAILGWLSGPFTSVSFKQSRGKVERGKSLGSVEGPKHFDVVRAPLSGEVLETNTELPRRPLILNRDPYGTGWFALIRPVQVEKETMFLKEAPNARADLERKLKELRVHCFADFPDYEMFEIGVECSAVLVKLNDLLARAPQSTVVHVVSDDPTAEVEMVRWSDQTGNAVLETRRENSLHHFIVKKTKS